MNTIPPQWIIVARVVVVALVALAAWFFYKQKKRSERQRFGPEYDRTVGELGGRTKGESELEAREKRVEHLTITPLAPAEEGPRAGGPAGK